MDHVTEFVGRHGVFAKKMRAAEVYGDPFVIRGQIGTRVFETTVGKEATCFTCLDYLGLGKHQPVMQNMADCIMRYGTATLGSRIIMDSDVLRNFEHDVADWKGSEDCMLVSSGYTASACLVSMLSQQIMIGGHRMKKKKTHIFVDRLAHASIQEGLLKFRNRKGKLIKVSVYAHLDYDALEKKLSAVASDDADRFIIADSLFSMTGSRPDCKRLAALAKKYGAIVVLDGAHCDGVFGEQGRGILFEDGITDEDRRFFFEAGTISKSLASIGGYITLPHALADVGRISQWRNIFSTALPTALVAADVFTLSLIRGQEGDERRKKITTLGDELLCMLKQEGFDTMNSESYIIPIVIGEESKCLRVQASILHKSSIIVGAIRFPAVEKEKAILRIAVTADHNEEDLHNCVKALKLARDEFKF
jgi:7-keto-8-aminopelargonate synthetase-like enzyme